MAILDLRRQASEAGVTLTQRTPLTEYDRQRAIATWKARMVNEHVSARVFAQLIPQMMRAGIDPSWQESISLMVTDELRHGRQCAGMVHALGGEPVAEIPDALADVPLHEDVEPMEGFLRNILSVSCLGETVAVALIRAEKNEVSTPEMESTLDEILADEVQHARFGWLVLDELVPQLSEETRLRLSDYLIGAFRHLAEHELHYLPIGDVPSEEAAAYGVCDGRDARRLFFDTVEKVIVPRLEEHGFKAEAAWQASQRPLPIKGARPQDHQPLAR
jgi:hypothetical protein